MVNMVIKFWCRINISFGEGARTLGQSLRYRTIFQSLSSAFNLARNHIKNHKLSYMNGEMFYV